MNETVKNPRSLKETGDAYFRAGEFNLAINSLETCLNCGVDDVTVLSMLSDAHAKIEQGDDALKYISKALELDPLNTPNLIKYSNLKLLGADYIDALREIHSQIKPRRYIEIGVCKGVSFNLADPDIIAIGVDPEPQIDFDNLPENHKVISDTSDNYFSSERVLNDLQSQTFDMAFLDGMHLFEFALRDFINLEKYSASDSVILIHDLFPISKETARRERLTGFWSGDVWKLVFCLKEYRPDIKLTLLPCPPTGLGAIEKLDSQSTILTDNYSKIVEKYTEMEFDREAHGEYLNSILASPDHKFIWNQKN